MRELNNKYETAKCCACRQPIPVGMQIVWDPQRPQGQRVIHVDCEWPEDAAPGPLPVPEPQLENVISIADWLTKRRMG